MEQFSPQALPMASEQFAMHKYDLKFENCLTSLTCLSLTLPAAALSVSDPEKFDSVENFLRPQQSHKHRHE